MDVITAHTREGESIFAVPSNAELYFLTQRRNPFRFYNTALGVRTDADLEAGAAGAFAIGRRAS